MHLPNCTILSCNWRAWYTHTMVIQTRTRWRLGALLSGIGVLCALLMSVSLERFLLPGSGWLWLALTMMLGGIGVDLLQRWHGRGAVCSPNFRPSPLQISCLASQAVGVVLFQQAPFAFLSPGWLPFVFVIGGVLGLGVLSVLGSCRDADLRDRV